MGPPKVITKSIQKEPELNKAENAWKPSKLEGKSIGPNSTEEEQTEVSSLQLLFCFCQCL